MTLSSTPIIRTPPPEAEDSRVPRPRPDGAVGYWITEAGRQALREAGVPPERLFQIEAEP